MRVKHTKDEIDLLARIMRSEAKGEGNFGMQLVGNVVVNRVIARCGTFKNIKTLREAIFQRGQFEGTTTPLFFGGATKHERALAKKCIDYWRAKPAYRALYFKNPGKNVSCPKNFWGPLSGRYKNHCFYNPVSVKKCGL